MNENATHHRRSSVRRQVPDAVGCRVGRACRVHRVYRAASPDCGRPRGPRLQDDIAAIVAALNDEQDPEMESVLLGREDPILQLPCPLGELDGRDKVLGLWTIEDWRNARTVRYRKAAEPTGAAAVFDDLSTQIEKAIVSRGLETTFDLFQ